MNKRDIDSVKNIGEGISLLLNMEGNIQEPIQTIYIVKCSEVHVMPASSIKRKNTYNLFSFENLEEAKTYMDLAHDFIIN